MPDPANPAAEGVRQVVVTFVRALRDRRTYPARNPIVVRRLAELHGQLSALLEKHDEVVLGITADALLWTGEAVYLSDDPRDSLAFALYRQGLRELAFTRGILAGEVEALVDALAIELPADVSDDDLMTLLWSADLRHIRYVASEDVTEGAPWARDPVAATARLVDALPEVPAPAAYAAALRSLGTAHLAAVAEPAGLALTPEDRAAHEALALEEQVRDVARDTVDVILQVLESSDRAEASLELTRVLAGIVESSVDTGAFERAASLLSHIGALAERSPSAALALRPAREHFASRPFLRKLVQRHNDAPEETPPSPRHLQGIALNLGAVAVPALVELGCELQDKRLRRALCDTLAQLARGDVMLLASATRATKWHVPRNAAYVLGQTRDPMAMKLLRGLVEHPHEKVRIEALRAVAHVSPEAAPDIIAHAIADRDRTVRLLALDLAANAPSAKLVESLVVKVRGAGDIDAQERRTIAIALGRIAGDAVLHIFKEMAVKRALFGRAKIDDARVAAVAGLVAIGSTDAESVLTEVHRSDQAFGPVIQDARRAVARAREGTPP